MNANAIGPKEPAHWGAVFAIALLASAAMFFYLAKENEKTQKISIKAELDRAAASRAETERQLKDLQLSQSAGELNIKALEEKIADLRQRLEEQGLARQKLEAALVEKDNEIRSLKVQLDLEKEEKKELADRLEKQYADYYNMRFQLQTLLKTKEELEKQAKELAENSAVSLGTIVIKQN